MKHWHIAVLFLIPTLLGCEKELGNAEISGLKKIVVQSSFSVKDSVKIRVDVSNPLFDKTAADSFGRIEMLVRINQELRYAKTVFNNTIDEDLNLHLKHKDTVSISLSSADLGSFSAQTIIPNEIDVISLNPVLNHANNRLIINLKFKDDRYIPNYYLCYVNNHIKVYTNSNGVIDSTIEVRKDLLHDITGVFQRTIYEPFRNKFGLFNDQLFDGQQYQMQFEVDLPQMSPDEKLIYKELVMKKVSKDYYRYLQSLMALNQTFGGPTSGQENAYTNINNGLGIHYSYSVFRDTVLHQ